MKIAVLGSTGMLGCAVGRFFIDKHGEGNVYTTYRSEDARFGMSFYLNPFVTSFETTLRNMGHIDYCINCIGKIKPYMEDNREESIFINSIFPWRLSNFCKRAGIKLIHITTDCVFSGREGKYTEQSPHDCLDAYGKSKSLGEPDDCMVLRTSIIGEEWHKQASLIEWLKSQKNGKANGFTNHLWNGVTTKQYAKVCATIIEKNLYEPSLFHVFSDTVTKEQLLRMVNIEFGLNIALTACEASESVDRTLSTVKALNRQLEIPLLSEQIRCIAEDTNGVPTS